MGVIKTYTLTHSHCKLYVCINYDVVDAMFLAVTCLWAWKHRLWYIPLAVFVFVFLSVSLPACLPVCLSVCLSVIVCVCDTVISAWPALTVAWLIFATYTALFEILNWLLMAINAGLTWASYFKDNLRSGVDNTQLFLAPGTTRDSWDIQSL